MKLTRLSAAVAAAAIAPAVLFASPAAAADGAQLPANSAPDKVSETKDGKGDKGTESAAKQDEDNKFAILRMLNGQPIGRGLEREANKALSGTAEDRRHFLEVGQYQARLEDDRVRVSTIISAGGPAVQAAGSKVLDDGGAEAIKEFLEKGRYAAQREDDEVRVSQIINDGGPAVKEAGKKALRGTDEDLKHFLETGQYEARKKDEAAEEAAKNKLAEDKGKKDAEQPSIGDGHKKDAGHDAAKPAQDGGKSSAKTASAKDAPAAASAKGGEMASTGADASVPWALGGGAAAVAAGAGMVVVARRRRAAEQG